MATKNHYGLPSTLARAREHPFLRPLGPNGCHSAIIPPPIGCPLKDVSSLAIRQGEGLDVGYHNAHQIQIHVDGGIDLDSDNCEDASSCNATWALAVVAVDELMQGKLMGSSGGHVTFNSASDVYLGENNPTSFDPELYAQAMARIFIIQHHDKFKPGVPILIGYYDISAADCAFMKAVESSDSILAGFTAALHIEAANLCSIEGFHVHSHLGHPWNELADSICNFYKNRRPMVYKIPFAPLTRRVCFEYQMFVSLQNTSILNSISVEESHCYNKMRALPPDVIASALDHPNYMQWDPACEVSSLFLNCVQFNVQTLIQFSARKHLLANFLRLQFAIGCFQEARSKSGRSRCIDNVLMIASESLRGNYGCEVWVNLSAPVYLKGGKKVYLNKDGVTKVFSEPRLLIVRCKGLKIDFYIISAHAPYVKSPTNFKDACEWWVHFYEVVFANCVQGIPVLAGIDGNYTVYGDASTGVGDVHRSGEPPPQHSSVCIF